MAPQTQRSAQAQRLYGAVDTGTTTTSWSGPHQDTPPSTPQTQRSRVDKGKGVFRVQPESTSLRTTPQDRHESSSERSASGSAAQRPRKHSHGLSWSSTTRDSVVDNLLSSLESISSLAPDTTAQPDVLHSSDPTSSPPYPPLSRLNYRARGHTYSSSRSSDYDRSNLDDGASHNSTRTSSRGHRSDRVESSPISVVQTFPAHQHTSSAAQRQARGGMRYQAGAPNGRKDNEIPRAEHVHTSAVTTGPLDDPVYDQTWPEIRSQSAQEVHADSILARGRPVPQANGIFSSHSRAVSGTRSTSDSAIPISHRSHHTQSSHRGTQKPSNLRAMEQADGGHNPGSSPRIPQEVRDQASDFVRASSMSTLFNSPQTAQGGFTVAGNRQQNLPVESRPGFFKRVFGSSSSRSNLHEMSPGPVPGSSQSRAPSPSNQQQTSVVGQAHIVSQVKEDVKAGTYSTPQPLSKKSSSFFRRRKKSAADESPIPPTPRYLPPTRDASPAPTTTNAAVSGTPASPSSGTPASPSASSLMNVMSHFIDRDENNTPPRPSPRSELVLQSSMKKADFLPSSEDTDDPDIFHSGYIPPPDASLRKTKPLGHGVSGGDAESSSATPTQKGTLPFRDQRGLQADNAVPRMKIKKSRPLALEPNSFLSDNSDTDDRLRPSSMVSDVSSTYGLPESTLKGRSSPVSPMSAKPPKPRGGPASPSMSPRLDLSDVSDEDVETPQPYAHPTLSLSTASPELDRHEFVVTAPSRPGTDERPNSATNRVWLEPSPNASEDEADSEGLSLPMEGAKASPIPSPLDTPRTFVSATSLPYLQASTEDLSSSPGHYADVKDATNDSEPTAEDRDRARRIYDGDQQFIRKGQAAAFLGEKKSANVRILKAYLDLFDFAGQNILTSMRGLCDNLILKGESQQVDRILDAFASRWCESNPNHGFKAKDVVHTMCYSLLLLNTDLHMAEIESKMTRNQFLKNTMPTIRHAATTAAESGDETIRPHATGARPSLPWQDSSGSNPGSPSRAASEAMDRKGSLDTQRPGLSKRMSFITGISDNTAEVPSGNGASNALVSQRGNQDMRIWQLEVENVLKSFFTAIRAEPLPLHKSAPPADSIWSQNNHNNIGSSLLPSALRRTGSIISKAPSEAVSMRARKTDFHSMTSRWTSKNRPRNKLYASSTLASSRTSFDDGGSIWSPAGSSTWSKYSMGKTQTTMSANSFGSQFMREDYQQSMGFASALSNAIIREEGTGAGDNQSISKIANLLEDENLELAGAPWAKEGIIKHRHHLEGPDKKAKERNWNECFAVIEKGWLRMFSFKNGTHNAAKASMRARIGKGKAASLTPSVVGGGNWMQNAEELESFLLRQTIASTLPPPGYSKARPHVWALSLPTGAVHLFQVGTAEIAREFMSTANYWSARLSKEPLFGGVSNIEYGWSDAIINPALIGSTSDAAPQVHSMPLSRNGTHSASNSFSTPRPSIASSMRGSLDQGSSRARLPGDRAQLTDWHPPVQSMMASQLMEVDQLKALQDYVHNVEDELNKHQDLRNAVALTYSSRHPNHTRAINNWEKKSQYLLREIIKFKTYIDSLEAAVKAKEKYYAEVDERAQWKKEREAKAEGLRKVDGL